MILKLDHIAIAVPNLEEAIKRFAEDLGLELAGREDVESALTSTAFFPIDGTQIELVHPLNDQGPIKGFLEKKGGGLHHICFETDNIAEDVEKLKVLGYRFLSDEPKLGAHGKKVIFIHPKSAGGVLIELAQPDHG